MNHMKKHIKFMVTAFRDGFQSVYGARVYSKDFLPAVEASAKAGIDHFEAGGGAMFQSPYFYSNEDSFAMMDAFRKAAGPNANLQTLARGINVVGLDSQPRDIIKLHAQLFKKHGITTIRNFDALNDVNNLIYSGQCIKDAGLRHEVVVTMMELPPGAPGADRAHTADFYLKTLRQILDAGIPYDSVCFKDASGTSAPRKVYETIKGARAMLGDKVTLVFHSHETAGVGITQYMLAIEAGADQIDLSLAPVSGGTCQTYALTLWHALRGTEYDLGIDVNKIMKLEEFFKDCMKDYFLPPEATKVEPLIPFFPMPGGALTTNTQMLRDNALMDKYPEVIAEMGEAVAKGGFGTSVTPVSQFYFQQAFNNVMFGKWKKIAEGYGKMVLGYFGKTPVEPDAEVMKVSEEQLNLKPTTELPIDINDKNPKKGIAAAKALLQKDNLPLTDENIFIAATCQEKGIAFLQGKATVGVRKLSDEKPKAEKAQEPTKPVPTSFIVTVNNNAYNVHIDGNTAVVDGTQYAISVQEGSEAPVQHPVKAPVQLAKQATPVRTAGPAPVPKPAAGGGSHKIIAPLPGLILRIVVHQGSQVAKGDTILVLESMKMETPIVASAAGVISEISVKQGDHVKAGQLLVTVQGEGGTPAPVTHAAPQPKPVFKQTTPQMQAAAKPAPAASTAQAAQKPVQAGQQRVLAPLPGLILRIPLKPGDKLNRGDTILVLESMKMETPIVAPSAGTLADISVKQGDHVKAGQLLATIQN